MVKRYACEEFYSIMNNISISLTPYQEEILKKIKEKSIILDNKNDISNKSNFTIDNSNKKSNSWRKEKPILIPKDISEIEKIKNKVTCLLNKLAPNNFDSISIKIIELIKINNILDHCVDEIFKKAVYQPVYCPYYVKLILLFSKKHYEIDSILSDMCEKFTNIISGTKKIINNNETYDEFCQSNKLKQFKIGYSQFIGELFNKELIVIEIIDIFIDELINNIFDLYEENSINLNIEYNIISLCKLLNTIYAKYPDILHNNKDKYHKIYNLELSNKLKFKILDIIELK